MIALCLILLAGLSAEVDNQWVRVTRGQAAMDTPYPTVTVSLKNGHASYSELHRVAVPDDAIVIELKAKTGHPDVKALDPVKLDPKHVSVILESDRVRVLRTVMEPHLKSPLHEHPPYVVIYLDESHRRMTVDGRTVDYVRKAGEVAWRDALKHETENTGEKTAVEIQVEIK